MFRTRFRFCSAHYRCYGKVNDAFMERAQSIFGGAEGRIKRTEAVLEQHGHDESYHPTKLPSAVCYPTETKQVSDLVRLCASERIPVIPFGTGTGLEGGIVPQVDESITIDLSEMEQKIDIRASDFDVTVSPSVTRVTLNNALKSDGLWFPVDPGADASICGMVATSASGTNAVRYGTMRENVLDLEVVLADGRVIHTQGGKRAKKTSAGFNLTNLFVGSEGSLGVITEATIRLHALPEQMLSAVTHFSSVADAIDAAVQIIAFAIPIARVEFLDETTMRACNKYSHFDYPEQPSLFLEFHGDENTIKQQVETVRDICSEFNSTQFAYATVAEERSKLWKARHDLLYATQALRPGHRCLITDVCVPISNLTEMILHSQEGIRKNNLIATMLGHVGDGNFHVLVLVNPNAVISDSFKGHVGDGNFHVFANVDLSDVEEVERAEKFKEEMASKALNLSGTCSGEHGIGMGKRSLLVREVGQDAVDVMRSIKSTLDPLNIMNPFKIFKN